MSVLRPRTRLIYFRVSEDEFHQLTDFCKSQEARSLSDVARQALKRLVEENNGGDKVGQQLTTLNQNVAELHKLLEEMMRRLNGEHTSELENV